jgi:hypothetical protein
MKNEIESVYTVTDYRTGKQTEEFILGEGQAAARQVMSKYPRFTKFVLDGFVINGTFVPLRLKKRYNDWS